MVKLLLPCGRGSLGLAVLFSLCAEFVSVSFFGHIPNYYFNLRIFCCVCSSSSNECTKLTA